MCLLLSMGPVSSTWNEALRSFHPRMGSWFVKPEHSHDCHLAALAQKQAKEQASTKARCHARKQDGAGTPARMHVHERLCVYRHDSEHQRNCTQAIPSP